MCQRKISMAHAFLSHTAAAFSLCFCCCSASPSHIQRGAASRVGQHQAEAIPGSVANGHGEAENEQHEREVSHGEAGVAQHDTEVRQVSKHALVFS